MELENLPEDYEPFVKALEYTSGEEAQWYSGRGMNGSKCVGIVLSGEVPAFVADIVGGMDERGLRMEACEHFQSCETDNMGYDTIMYFPDMKPEQEEQDVH